MNFLRLENFIRTFYWHILLLPSDLCCFCIFFSFLFFIFAIFFRFNVTLTRINTADFYDIPFPKHRVQCLFLDLPCNLKIVGIFTRLPYNSNTRYKETKGLLANLILPSLSPRFPSTFPNFNARQHLVSPW